MAELEYSSPVEFEQIMLDSRKPILVDFYADWCGPCNMLAPEIEDIKQKYARRLIVVKVNTDEHPDLAEYFDVMGIPTILFFAEGAMQWRKSGFDRGLITRMIDEHFG